EARAKAIVRPPSPLRGAESDRQVAGDDGAARSPGQPAGSKPPVPGEEREEEYGHADCGWDIVACPEAVHQTLQCPDRHLEQGGAGAGATVLAGFCRRAAAGQRRHRILQGVRRRHRRDTGRPQPRPGRHDRALRQGTSNASHPARDHRPIAGAYA
ncbi:hypothetical protein KXV85_005627, partial [Aspergillus fumigatus]